MCIRDSLRGEDFNPVLQGRVKNWDTNIYLEYSMHHGAKTHMRGIRTPEWKFMVDFANPGRRELYRLTDDPQELENLAYKTERETQDVMTELMNNVVSHMERINDPLIDELKPQVKNDSE